MLGLECGMVRLCAHDPDWDAQAKRTIELLRRILGDAALDIQHVGSTAVPSIMAKPILDFAVAAQDFEKVLAHRAQLQENGFYDRTQAQTAVRGQLLFAAGSYYDGTGDLQTHFVHVVRAGSPDWNNYLRFRDFLRSNPAAAKAYEARKIELAAQFSSPGGRQAYLLGKQALIAELLLQAAV